MVTVWPQSFRNRLNITNGQRLECVKGSWQTPEFLCISKFLQVLSSLHSANTKRSPWTRVFRDGNIGGGREREAKTVMPQCASGDRHHILRIHTWSCNCELLQGGGVNHDSVRVGLEQAQGELPQENEACAEMVKEQTSTGDDEVGGRKTL